MASIASSIQRQAAHPNERTDGDPMTVFAVFSPASDEWGRACWIQHRDAGDGPIVFYDREDAEAEAEEFEGVVVEMTLTPIDFPG